MSAKRVPVNLGGTNLDGGLSVEEREMELFGVNLVKGGVGHLTG